MTCKEQRSAQLDALKEAGQAPVKYHVERLNACFTPYKTYIFDTMEEAEKAYNKLILTDYPAYVRKYATVSF